ncbi:MAG: hypothetical protein HY554_11125 [Elusimicrobia bacterium]|nr:hypothetical protein [Elusimicrobiota bacterium]
MKTILAAGLLGLLAGEAKAEPGFQLAAYEPLPLEETGTVAPVVFRLSETREAGKGAELAVRMWQIQILDHRGEKVSFLQGRGAPPSRAIPWFGLTTGGELLEDGFYWAKLVWVDSQKAVHQTEKAVFGLRNGTVLSEPWLRKLLPQAEARATGIAPILSSVR